VPGRVATYDYTTTKADELLNEGKLTVQQISEKTGIPPSSISSRRRKLGLVKKREPKEGSTSRRGDSLSREVINIRIFKGAASEINSEKLFDWLNRQVADGDVVEHGPDGFTIARDRLLTEVEERLGDEAMVARLEKILAKAKAKKAPTAS
jgi:hypothetical protein